MPGGVFRAMDEDVTVGMLHGYRKKWRKLNDASEHLAMDSEQHVSFDDDVLTTDHVDSSVLNSNPASTLEPAVTQLDSFFGPGLGVDPQLSGNERNSDYEPSVAQSSFGVLPGIDQGGLSSKQDDNAAITDTFIRGAKFSAITMPWETPLMSQIFGDLHPTMRLSMPLDWGNRGLPVLESATAGPSQPAVPSDSRWQALSYVRHKTDETYLQQRTKTLNNALSKWRFLVLVDVTASEVGRQLDDASEEHVDLVLNSAMGVKSPNTIMKRANAMMLYYRWHAVYGTAPMLPFDERDIWTYVMGNAGTTTSASRSQSLVQALRFAHYVLGFDNALACADSRRVKGQAQIQVSLREPMKQARPLTVEEVKALHRIADSASYSKVDRCIASNLLLAMYGRCRVSDLNHVHEVLHDLSGGTGFLEVTTRCHKSARTAQQKSVLLPILMSCSGVAQFPWVHSWIANRKACDLPTSGLISGALMPTPMVGDYVSWMRRPLSAGEVTGILKGFLQTNDQLLSSHSLKATALSWAAKAEVPREQRRILGRHSSSVQGSDSYYSRDLSVGPVNSLQKVICMIRDGSFQPDATRANYFPHVGPRSAGTPAHIVMQPFTPAYLERAQPGTPGLEQATPAVAVQAVDERKHGAEATAVDVKSEASWSAMSPGNTGCGVIELTSSSEGESSESNTCSSTSGEDEPIDLDPPAGDEASREPVAVGDVDGIMIKNNKTKIVHEVIVEHGFREMFQSDPLAFLKGKLTKCGHVVTANYHALTGPIDWTAKCRVCYKGRRAPS